MATGTGQSSLFGAHAAEMAKAHKEHKAAAPPVDNNLPAGIASGIAQVRMCKFDTYKDGDNKGKIFWFASAVVVSPEEVNVDPASGKVVSTGGIPTKIKGLRTSIGPEKMFPTPESTWKDARKTFADHWRWMQDQLKLLVGVDAVATIDGTPQQIEDGIKRLMAAVEQRKPFIKFKTFKFEQTADQPDPRVNHKWLGVVSFTPNTSPAAGTKDNTAEGAAGNGEADSHDAAPSNTTQPFTGDMSPSEELDALAVVADAAGANYESVPEAAAAVIRIQEMAAEYGVSEDAMGEAENWTAVAELVKAALPSEDQPEQAADEPAADEAPAEEHATPPVVPVKGNLFLYKVLDAAGKPLVDKKSGKDRKPIQCEVKLVDKKSSTCTLLQSSDGKTEYKKVPWSQLIPQA